MNLIYEEYKLDSKWKNRLDIPEYKIYSIGFDDNTFEIGFTGLIGELSNLRLNTDKYITQKIEYLYKSKDYNKTKKIYLDLLKSNKLSKTYLCNSEDYSIICSVFKEF